jgi:anti-anti-sigma factor
VSAISYFSTNFSTDAFAEPRECHTAHFVTRWVDDTTAVVSADGEIDAANAQEFVAYAMRHRDRLHRLVVDLTGVEFFGTSGFSALHTLNVRTAGEDIYWALTPGPPVSRLLRICDPDGALPVYDSVSAALAALEAGDRRHKPLLKLVAESR